MDKYTPSYVFNTNSGKFVANNVKQVLSSIENNLGEFNTVKPELHNLSNPNKHSANKWNISKQNNWSKPKKKCCGK